MDGLDDAEKQRLRREILADVGGIFAEHHAAQEWGRVLVEVAAAEDAEPRVAGIEVQDIVGDEARVDDAFAPERVAALLPVLAEATQALCALDDVELERVRGGTFIRQRAGGYAWLPGLVQVPSPAFENVWDEAQQRLKARQGGLEDRFGLGLFERYDLDIEHERIAFSSGGQPGVEGRATLIGTYSLASRTWAWGGLNPNLPEGVRRSSAALVDAIEERDMWELSTPLFPVDEATAWALAALVCDRAGGQGVYRGQDSDNRVFVMLRDVRVA